MTENDFFDFHGERYFLTDFALKYLLNYELIVDGASGGLIVGNSHADGGIKGIHKNEFGRYEITAEVEGYEYLLNPLATKSNTEYTKELNESHKHEIGNFVPYDIPDNIKILDARPKMISGFEHQRLIIFSAMPQQVLNKVSSKNYLEELDKLNKETWINK